ncbi:MAG: L-lactate dehydrogenase [Desulfosarcina sp.]
MIQRRTVGIVGTGNVGVAAAYAIFMAGLASEIILIDKDHRRAEGEAMDLMHGQAFAGRVTVRAGEYPDLEQAQVIVVTAGVSGQPGESRLALLGRNARVFTQIVGELDRYSPESVLVIASNPVDIMTWITQQSSRRSPGLVIGTGTMLDTARFRALIGDYYDVDPRSVHATIIGEHGDSEVPLWSTATIGGISILNHAILGKSFDRNAMDRLFEKVRTAAYEIIDRKGYTSSAIGLSIMRLVAAVFNDQQSVLPVSRQVTGAYGIDNICLSIPSLVGNRGVQDALPPPLSQEEHEGIMNSANILKQSLADLERPK